MTTTLHHNKKRNSALLYEFLFHHITNCVMENNNKDATRALSILKKYFYSSESPLRSELKAFNLILNSNIPDKDSIKKILNEICEYVSKLDIKASNGKKSELIKEINHSFGKDTVWKYKIPNYKTLATIQVLFNSLRGSDVENNIERIKLKNMIVESLATRNSKQTVVENIKTNPKYSKAVYKFAMKRFDEKYKSTLNENQIRLLTQYTTYMVNGNKEDFSKLLLKEISSIGAALKNIKDTSIKEDKSIQEKILECQKKLETFDVSNITDTMVTEIMRYQSLVKEFL